MNYIKVSDVVKELSVARKDNNRVEYLSYLILSKQVLKDLRIKYLNDYKRVYLPVNPSTNTVRIPFDFYRFRTISVLQMCPDAFGKQTEKVIPLTLNPYINITPQEPIVCESSCNCEINHPVCQELANYELIEEDVNVTLDSSPPVAGTRQTILRTCANGDVIKEVTEPVQKWVEGNQVCDYAIEMNITVSICSYELDIEDFDFANPNFVVSFNLNGFTATSAPMNSLPELTTFMESYGWTHESAFVYTLENSNDIYSDFSFSGAFGEEFYSVNRTCTDGNLLQFPYTIISYVKNGETVEPSPPAEISDQADLDDFFEDLGFTKVDDTHYSITETEDVFFSVLIETGDSPSEEVTINFTQSNCTRPLVNAGYENQLFTDILCNVDLKDCGCIAESQSNITKIVSCCSPYLQCCQTGEITGWKGWGFVPSCCPTNSEQPYNRFGTYALDERNYLIYLDSVNATRVLLAYDSDGSCESEYLIPDFTMDALKAGIAYYHSEYNEEISPFRRRELEINYNKKLDKLQRDYTDVIRMPDLINALRTRKYPY